MQKETLKFILQTEENFKNVGKYAMEYQNSEGLAMKQCE